MENTVKSLYKVTGYNINNLSTYNTHVGNCFTGLCTKCTGYNNNLVIAEQTVEPVVLSTVLTVDESLMETFLRYQTNWNTVY